MVLLQPRLDWRNAADNGEWHRVNTAQLNALTDVAADDTPAAGNALKFSDIASGEDIDVWLGKDADGNLYVASVEGGLLLGQCRLR